MNLFELADKVEFEGMPAEETARNLRKAAIAHPDCPHCLEDGSCSIIDQCENTPCEEPQI